MKLSTGARPPASARANAAIARATGCSLASSAEPASRTSSARSTPSPATTPTTVSAPSVTVPVLSSTIVVIRRVCSRISGPRIRIPSCAPRPVPTISAVGVARPSAHGHAMISTATAAVNAAETSPVTRSQPASVASESADHDRDEDGRDAVDEPLDRCLPGLRIRDETGDLGQGGVVTDLRRLDDEPARGVDRGAGNRRSLPHLDRHRLARQHRLIDGRGAGDDDPVGCDLLAGTHDEAVADRELGDRHEHLGVLREERARPSRRARAGRRSPHPSDAGRVIRGSGRAGSTS